VKIYAKFISADGLTKVERIPGITQFYFRAGTFPLDHYRMCIDATEEPPRPAIVKRRYELCGVRNYSDTQVATYREVYG
jgi:hypothetical protein